MSTICFNEKHVKISKEMMMSISIGQEIAFNSLAHLLYNFLPGSGNNNFSFPLAAEKTGVSDFWILLGSKKPAILDLLKKTYSERSQSFCKLITEIVRLAIGWRNNKNDPVKLDEIVELNKLLLVLGFKIPELHKDDFLAALSIRGEMVSERSFSNVNETMIVKLESDLCKLLDLKNPQQRGFEFEKFLTELFNLYGLNPRPAFKLKGEKIDGSINLSGHTYLVEAKWQGQKIGNSELGSFSTKITTKAKWSRGLYISYSGFSEDGLFAFSRSPTSIICMSGLELHQMLAKKCHLGEVLMMKSRRAAETGNAFDDSWINEL